MERNLESDKLLKDYATVKTGYNIVRIKNALNTYSHDDFLNDFNQENQISDLNCIKKFDLIPDNLREHVVHTGDLIFEYQSARAAIVQADNNEKIINQNFGKVIISSKQLDKKFLCFYLNEASESKRQYYLANQGMVKRITSRVVESIRIPKVVKQVQENLGQAYFNSIKLETLVHRKSILQRKLLKTKFQNFLNDKYQ